MFIARRHPEIPPTMFITGHDQEMTASGKMVHTWNCTVSAGMKPEVSFVQQLTPTRQEGRERILKPCQ